MKTSELTGPVLDWAVAKALGHTNIYTNLQEFKKRSSGIYLKDYPYSTSWNFGGSIIERERISVTNSESGDEWNAEYRFNRIRDDEYWSGPTPLIAAMRCYVASKLGDEIKIPEELL